MGITEIPRSIQIYEGFYPEVIEFQELWNYIYVPQGGGKVSEGSASLISDGFSHCTACLVNNPDKFLVGMFHFEPAQRFYHEQKKMLEQFESKNGEAIFIEGSHSRAIIDEKDLLKSCGISHIREITVDTGEVHFGVVYRPKDNLILVLQRSQHQVLTYDGFQGITS